MLCPGDFKMRGEAEVAMARGECVFVARGAPVEWGKGSVSARVSSLPSPPPPLTQQTLPTLTLAGAPCADSNWMAPGTSQAGPEMLLPELSVAGNMLDQPDTLTLLYSMEIMRVLPSNEQLLTAMMEASLKHPAFPAKRMQPESVGV